jgi:hypothetical protein
MRTWVDKRQANAIASALNSIELESQRLRALLKSALEEGEPAKATMTTPQVKMVEKPNTYECSVCGRNYRDKGDLTSGSMSPDKLLVQFRNFALSGQKPFYRYCSYPCAEKLGNALTFASSNVAEARPDLRVYHG